MLIKAIKPNFYCFNFSFHNIARIIIIVFVILSTIKTASAGPGNSPGDTRAYNTPKERREAGTGYEITEWATISGLVDMESGIERFNLKKAGKHSENKSTSYSFESNLLLEPLDQLKSEFVYEYDSDLDKHLLDEAILSLESDDFEIELGKMYMPFGEYYSNFANGPVIENAESRGAGLKLSYPLSESIEIAPFAFYRWSPEKTWLDPGLKWGLALEADKKNSYKAGLSFISDLGGSSVSAESISKEEESFINVPAVNTYIAFDYRDYTLTFEFISSLDKANGLQNSNNKPYGFNFEASRRLNNITDFSLRYEFNDEFQDNPHKRFGAAINIRLLKNIFMTIEGMVSDYKKNLSRDKYDHRIDSSNAILTQLSIEF